MPKAVVHALEQKSVRAQGDVLLREVRAGDADDVGEARVEQRFAAHQHHGSKVALDAVDGR